MGEADRKILSAAVDSYNFNTIMGNRGVITETQLQAVTALLSMNSEDTLKIQEGMSAGSSSTVFIMLRSNILGTQNLRKCFKV